MVFSRELGCTPAAYRNRYLDATAGADNSIFNAAA